MANTNKIKLGPAKVTFGSLDLGLTQGGVEVEVSSSTHETIVDQFGDTVVNEFLMGKNITVKVPMAESTLTNVGLIMPESVKTDSAAAAEGSVTITNADATGFIDVLVNNVSILSAPAPVGVDNTATAAAIVGNDDGASGYTLTNTLGVVEITADELGDGPNDNVVTVVITGGSAVTAVTADIGDVVKGASRVDVSVAAGASLLTSSQKLVVHPSALPDNDKTEDLVVPFANCPGELQYTYNLDQERIFVCNFKGYPDLNSSSGSKLFHIGDEDI